MTSQPHIHRPRHNPSPRIRWINSRVQKRLSSKMAPAPPTPGHYWHRRKHPRRSSGESRANDRRPTRRTTGRDRDRSFESRHHPTSCSDFSIVRAPIYPQRPGHPIAAGRTNPTLATAIRILQPGFSNALARPLELCPLESHTTTLPLPLKQGQHEHVTTQCSHF